MGGTGKVSTDQDDVVAFGQFGHTLIKICDPALGDALRNTQGNGVEPWPDTHGSQVAEIHGQGFVTQLPRHGPLFPKVDILQEKVGAESPVFFGTRRMKDGRIVSNPPLERGASAAKPFPQQADNLVLAPRCCPRLSVQSHSTDSPVARRCKDTRRTSGRERTWRSCKLGIPAPLENR
jgi:hypothetical protein